MKRREFLKSFSAGGLLSMLDPAYLRAKEGLQSGQSATALIPKRQYGRAKDMISVIGFGGIVVKDVTPEEASSHVAEAVDRGINYFDVAPTRVASPFRSRLIVADFVRDKRGAWHFLEAGPGAVAGTAHEGVFKHVAATTIGRNEDFQGDDVGGPLDGETR